MAQAWGARPSALLGLSPGSLEAFQVDRALAARLVDAERVPAEEDPSLLDVVDAIPSYDDAPAPDPFADVPAGMG